MTYCLDKAAPEGSAAYYATLLLPAARRPGVLALLALKRELEDAVEACSESAVAERKLAWWHEELGRMADGAPQHPVTRALVRHAHGALPAPDAAALLAGARHRVSHPQFRDVADLDASCSATAGCIGRACARLLVPDQAARAEGYARALAALERVRLLGLPRRAGLPPHAGVPLDLMSAAGATPAQVDRAGTTGAATRLRSALLDSATAGLDAAWQRLPGARGFDATCVQIGFAQLRALRRAGYVADGGAHEPLPIALLWIAWRHRPHPRGA